MKVCALILGLVAFAAASTDVFQEAQAVWKLQTGQPWPGPQMMLGTPLASESDFQDFKTMYNKKYATKEEHQVRLRSFQINQLLAQAFQAKEKGTAKYGMTKFSDMSYKEFKQYYRNLDVSQMKSPSKLARIPRIRAPTGVDWRERNAVTPVKNQGQCGSCWSFSTTGNIEGHWAIKKGQLMSLSEQQIMDCDTTCYGCGGGWPTKAFEYVHQTGGLELESEYPYETRQGSCRSNPSEYKVYVNSSLQITTDRDEYSMASWCAANGPISILVNAGTMQQYQGGIAYQDAQTCDPAALDHAILIVGYGETSNEPYWIVKNSWGPDWGDQGYWMVYRGYDVCGLATTPTSSVIE